MMRKITLALENSQLIMANHLLEAWVEMISMISTLMQLLKKSQRSKVVMSSTLASMILLLKVVSQNNQVRYQT